MSRSLFTRLEAEELEPPQHSRARAVTAHARSSNDSTCFAIACYLHPQFSPPESLHLFPRCGNEMRTPPTGSSASEHHSQDARQPEARAAVAALELACRSAHQQAQRPTCQPARKSQSQMAEQQRLADPLLSQPRRACSPAPLPLSARTLWPWQLDGGRAEPLATCRAVLATRPGQRRRL